MSVEKKAVMVLSGGLDSTTLLYKVIDMGYKVVALSVNYGQNHKKELDFAKKTCEKLGVEHHIIECPFIGQLFNSSLISGADKIPEGDYREENMKSTVVPSRNLIFGSIAIGYAQSIGAEVVALGVHGGDHTIYPDCRPEFIEKLNEIAQISDWNKVEILTPYINSSKADIVADGLKLGVDYSLTWTCYKGGEKPCGKCGSCRERIEAFELNNSKDPLDYN